MNRLQTTSGSKIEMETAIGEEVTGGEEAEGREEVAEGGRRRCRRQEEAEFEKLAQEASRLSRYNKKQITFVKWAKTQNAPVCSRFPVVLNSALHRSVYPPTEATASVDRSLNLVGFFLPHDQFSTAHRCFPNSNFRKNQKNFRTGTIVASLSSSHLHQPVAVAPPPTSSLPPQIVPAVSDVGRCGGMSREEGGARAVTAADGGARHPGTGRSRMMRRR
ncbi:hypothetical protein ACS0TY_017265 [Phlomoides rotata]